MVSVTTTQLYHYGPKAADGDTQTEKHGCVPVRFYLQEHMEARTGLRSAYADPCTEASLIIESRLSKTVRPKR